MNAHNNTFYSMELTNMSKAEVDEMWSQMRYSQTCLISHWRDCLYYVILNGVDVKRSCSTEVNVSIQQFVLLLYTTVNINVHVQLHDFQCASTVHQKVTRRHAAVSIIQLTPTE